MNGSREVGWELEDVGLTVNSAVCGSDLVGGDGCGRGSSPLSSCEKEWENERRAWFSMKHGEHKGVRPWEQEGRRSTIRRLHLKRTLL